MQNKFFRTLFLDEGYPREVMREENTFLFFKGRGFLIEDSGKFEVKNSWFL